ncbi:hypothetical protein EJ06DRAFT_530018 [Trichodelitschia bisporula]|uniref:Uncharacterized protein n=1 Tax=Trichodelitschia bisporula TaxID=703511 RepID=A0A6G1HYE3_9PEZI|nr:hypothetical protein EJ06DRAFT_530018 [Trichodelitschia bisporula]
MPPKTQKAASHTARNERQTSVPQNPSPEADDSASDSDEAPEAISLSTAQLQSRALRADAAKAIQEQKAAEKRRRTQRDAQLKDQAQNSKRRKVEQAAEESADEEGGQSEDGESSAEDSDTAVVSRAPVAKSRAVALSGRPPKDVKRGPVAVHVLDQANPLLPPKMNKHTKHIKDMWLKGRPTMMSGKKAVSKVDRKPVRKVTSFV